MTDKGNYSMFEVVRGVPSHAPAGYAPIPGAGARGDPTPPESAWERGLRTAKEVCSMFCVNEAIFGIESWTENLITLKTALKSSYTFSWLR